MAGFAQSGSPGFSVSPPRINPVVGSNRLQLLGIPQYAGGQAGYINPESSVGSSRLDTSPEHMANIFLAQQGLLPKSTNSSRGPSEDPYGLGANDWLDVRKFTGNTLDPKLSSNYQNLIGRLRATIGGSLPGFSNEQFNRFTNDLPIRTGLDFGVLPPMTLQGWPYWPGVPGS